MHRFVLALFGFTLGAVSCSASTEQALPGAPNDSATLVSPTGVVQVTVDGSRIYGPQVELTRDSNGLRGRGPVGVVDLRKEGGGLRGVVGGGPTELYVEGDGERGDGFSVRGLFGGVLGNLDVRSDRVQGQIGRCQYNLHRHAAEEGVAYSGQRICGGKWMEPASLTLSPGIAGLDPTERAALMTILLGR